MEIEREIGKTVEKVLCNRIKNIGEKEQTYIGYPEGLIEELSNELTSLFKTYARSLVPIKMDYLKWQLRKDLTREKGKKKIEIKEAENKAKGWNRCREEILRRIEEANNG